jgi:copper chaperone
MSTTQKRTLTIDGMHCDHCVDAVRDALDALDGVTVHSVDIGSAEISYDTSLVSEENVAAAVDDAGYELTA